MVTWEKPDNDGGSVHLDYIVTYSKIKMETTKENITKQLFITLDQLEPSTKYNIAVKARNPGERVYLQKLTQLLILCVRPFIGFHFHLLVW